MSEGIGVIRRQNESLEGLISRFRHKVESEGILKDHKLNVMFSREERKRFKEFSNKRRSDKKSKRVKEAIDRTHSGNYSKKKDGVI
jgi:ribosomal protein S21